MPSETPFEIKSSVVALRAQHFSYPKIVESLSAQEIVLSYWAVNKYCTEESEKQKGWTKPAKRLAPQNLPSARTKDIIKKVKKAVLKQNPESSRKISRKLQVSYGTVSNIIHGNLGLVVRKKKRVHSLTDVQKKQRYERAKFFISYLGPFKTRLIFTMDETWITLDDYNVEKDHYYTDGEIEIPEDWKKKPTKQWPKKIMVAIGICWFGMSRAYVVDGSAKVTAQVFIDQILSKMVQKDLPKLYGDRAKDVIFHMDSAPSHTAKKTVKWLQDNQVKYIPKDRWMANAPDAAPLDYAVNGNLKNILSHRKATTLKGLATVINDVCRNYDLDVIRKSLSSWQTRVQKMIDSFGDHVELNKK